MLQRRDNVKYALLDNVIFDSKAIISRLNNMKDENLLCISVKHHLCLLKFERVSNKIREVCNGQKMYICF